MAKLGNVVEKGWFRRQQRNAILGENAAKSVGLAGSGRLALVNSRAARLARLRFVMLALVSGVFLSFASGVSLAEFVFVAGNEGTLAEEFGVSVGQDFGSSEQPAESGDNQKPGVPETPAAPSLETDTDLDAAEGGTTSAPVSPTGGSSPLAGLPTAGLRFSLSAASCRISVIESIAPDSPHPNELLDPPRA